MYLLERKPFNKVEEKVVFLGRISRLFERLSEFMTLQHLSRLRKGNFIFVVS